MSHTLGQYAWLVKYIIPLKFYGLHLFRLYLNERLSLHKNTKWEDLTSFGKKFDAAFDSANKVIMSALRKTYTEIRENSEGNVFSLPRDPKIWERAKYHFREDSLLLFGEPKN